MKRITRISKDPAVDLQVGMTVGGGGNIYAPPATDDGPQFSEVVSDEVAEVFEKDEGLKAHFAVESVDPGTLSPRLRSADPVEVAAVEAPKPRRRGNGVET